MSCEDAFFLHIAEKDHSLIRTILNNTNVKDVEIVLKELISPKAECAYNRWKEYEQQFLSLVNIITHAKIMDLLYCGTCDPRKRDAEIRSIVPSTAWNAYYGLQNRGDFTAYPDLFLNELNVVLRAVAKKFLKELNTNIIMPILEKIISISSESAANEFRRWKNAENRRRAYEKRNGYIAIPMKTTEELSIAPCKFCSREDTARKTKLPEPLRLEPSLSSKVVDSSVAADAANQIKPHVVSPNSKAVKDVSTNSIKPAAATSKREPALKAFDHENPPLPDLLKFLNTNPNIVILGESGVGKSTFVNAFVNYMAYGTLQDAIACGAKICIETKFTVTDANYETQEVHAKSDRQSKEKSNEVLEPGKSSTQDPRSYRLEQNQKAITLIDTPGIGDVRGIEQDKKNFEKILQVIGQYSEIHAICILLKPNNSKRTIAFRYFIDELLQWLPKTATENILFCFTNSRGTFYRPGDTLPALKLHLQESQLKGLASFKLERESLFCFDNEAFRYLCAHRQNPELSDEEDLKNAMQSWKHSSAEAIRLVCQTAKLPVYRPVSSRSNDDIVPTIYQLARPIAEIHRNLLTNRNIVSDAIAAFGKKKKASSELNLAVLGFDHYWRPRMLCSSGECIKYSQEKRDVQKFQRLVCHEDCSCETKHDMTIAPCEFRPPKNCIAFLNGSSCPTCSCDIKKHIHQRYNICQEYVPVAVKQKISSTFDWLIGTPDGKNFNNDPEDLINGYVNNLKFLKKTSIFFCNYMVEHGHPQFKNRLVFYHNFFASDEERNSLESYDFRLATALTEFARELGSCTQKTNGFDRVPNKLNEMKKILLLLLNMEDYKLLLQRIVEFEQKYAESTKQKFETEVIDLPFTSHM